MFSPSPCIGAVIKLSEQFDAILILLKFMRYWVPMLQQLPIVNAHDFSWFDDIYRIDSRAPDHLKKSKPKHVLTAYLVGF